MAETREIPQLPILADDATRLVPGTSPAIRVLHIATRHRRGGARRNLVQRVGLESAAGDDVTVVVGADSDIGDFAPPIRVVQIHALRRRVDPVNDLRALLQLRRLMTQRQFDIVHTHQSKAGVVGRLAARGRATVVVHTVHMAAFGGGYSPLQSKLFRAAERSCGRLTDYLIFVGWELQKMYADAGIGHRDRRLVLRSPIDIDGFAAARHMTAEERRSARSLLGLKPDVPVVVAAGLLEPRKRFSLIVQSLAPLLRAGQLQLVIAGEGPLRDELAALVGRLDLRGMHLLGYVGDMPRLFSAADLLVHASVAEGVPQVVIQALAAGVPVVATLSEGLCEVPGAPISVVDRSGMGLQAAVLAAVGAPREPVPLSCLKEWRPDDVAGKLAIFHEHLREKVRCADRLDGSEAGAQPRSRATNG